jgi:TatA/E family protein of Tat protein translocase
MFGVGFQEILVVMVIALLVFGPKKLPELARMLGKAMSEFRKAVNDVKTAMEVDEIKSYKPEKPELPASESSSSTDDPKTESSDEE